jgi:hypothetical protein
MMGPNSRAYNGAKDMPAATEKAAVLPDGVGSVSCHRSSHRKTGRMIDGRGWVRTFRAPMIRRESTESFKEQKGARSSRDGAAWRALIRMVLRVLVPLVKRWVAAQQARILTAGVALTPKQLLDAQLAGVKEPRKVRLMQVERIPMPADFILRHADRLVRLMSGDTAGITFGYGIYIRRDLWGDRELVVHELVHVGQYERLGSVEAFLRSYLEECCTHGYPNGPLEQEAITRTQEICG